MNAPDLLIAHDDTYSVEPREIEQVIQSMWRDAVGDDGETTLTQVRTLNLLVIVAAAALDDQLSRAIDAVAVQHPGRTITMLISDDQAPPRAQVAIACRFGGNGKTVCGEQITIRSGNGGAPLPNIAAALLIAGVPTFVWWHGDPPLDGTLFRSFADSADRVVLDSRTWNEPIATLHQLAAITGASSTAYTDLQWTAITPWRRLIAQCFDLPAVLQQLPHMDQITIEYGRAAADQIAALFLLGWFGSRLSWTVERVTADQISFGDGQRTIGATLRAVDDDGLQHAQFRSAGATIDLQFDPTMQCIKTAITLTDAPVIERMARLAHGQIAQQISEELDMLERDGSFEAALQVAVQLAVGTNRSDPR